MIGKEKKKSKVLKAIGKFFITDVPFKIMAVVFAFLTFVVISI